MTGDGHIRPPKRAALEALDKEQLLEMLEMSAEALRRTVNKIGTVGTDSVTEKVVSVQHDRLLWEMATGLHGAYATFIQDPMGAIALQKAKIDGLRHQLFCQQRGYSKRIRKLEGELARLKGTNDYSRLPAVGRQKRIEKLEIELRKLREAS